jgi:hypothetical protein
MIGWIIIIAMLCFTLVLLSAMERYPNINFNGLIGEARELKNCLMALMVRRLSKLRPEQLTFQNPYYSKIKYVAHELGLPTLFLINLLRYNKLNY